jgi:protein required for attachment to host cells
MDTTWVLVANGERARCFERRTEDHALIELADFVHPQSHAGGKAGPGDVSGDAGKGHGRTGHAGTQFEPHLDAQAKERGNFATQLANYLNQGVNDHQCNQLVLLASPALLGELKPRLSVAAAKALQITVASDLTRYTGSELKERVSQALALSH